MKKPTILLATLWLLPAPTLAADGALMQIGIDGMVCKFCVARVARELKALPGVKGASVSLKDGRAEIIVSNGEHLEAAAVRKAIEDAGFTPGEVETAAEMPQ